jgi:hypothetical protein
VAPLAGCCGPEGWGSGWFADQGLARRGCPQVYGLYEVESVQDPQMAFDAIVSDYSLTCATIELAVTAAWGGYTSPVYAFINKCECLAPVYSLWRSNSWLSRQGTRGSRSPRTRAEWLAMPSMVRGSCSL